MLNNGYGVLTTEPGFTLGNDPDDEQSNILPMLALMGRVPIKVKTENGPILPGDSLTLSSKPGYAMLCKGVNECNGIIIGKALERLDKDEGLILALVSTR